MLINISQLTEDSSWVYYLLEQLQNSQLYNILQCYKKNKNILSNGLRNHWFWLCFETVIFEFFTADIKNINENNMM